MPLPWGELRISPEGVGVIGGEAPYTTNGWWAGLEKFRLRAAYFLRAEKVGKDALRGVRAPIAGDSTRTLAVAAGARALAAVPPPAPAVTA